VLAIHFQQPQQNFSGGCVIVLLHEALGALDPFGNLLPLQVVGDRGDLGCHLVGRGITVNWIFRQRSIQNAGLVIEPDQLVVLNKGQRSVKGLASGFEHVATLDLIMTMVPNGGDQRAFVTPPQGVVIEATRSAAADGGLMTSPSHIYLELLRRGMREHWDLSELDLRLITQTLIADGWEIDEGSGRLRKSSELVLSIVNDRSYSTIGARTDKAYTKKIGHTI